MAPASREKSARPAARPAPGGGGMTPATRITLLRLLAVPAFLILMLHGRFFPAFWVGLAAGLTDAVDGWVARRTGISRLGSILDPLADKLLLLAAYGVLVHLRVVPSWVLVVVVSRDVLVSGGWGLLYVLTGSSQVLPSVSGKVATAGQMLFGLFVLMCLAFPEAQAELTPVLPDLQRAMVALTLLSMLDYLVIGNRRFSKNGSDKTTF